MAWFGCLAMVHVETYVTILGGMNHKQLEFGRQGDWVILDFDPRAILGRQLDS